MFNDEFSVGALCLCETVPTWCLHSRLHKPDRSHASQRHNNISRVVLPSSNGLSKSSVWRFNAGVTLCHSLPLWPLTFDLWPLIGFINPRVLLGLSSKRTRHQIQCFRINPWAISFILHYSSSHSCMNEYLVVDRGRKVWTSGISALIAVCLNTSQRSRHVVDWTTCVCQECKALWSVLKIGHRAVWELVTVILKCFIVSLGSLNHPFQNNLLYLKLSSILANILSL